MNMPLVIGGVGGPEVHVGTTDPSGGGGLAAPLGSAYFKTDTGQLFRKSGALDTDWTEFGGGGGGSYSQGWYGTGIDGDVTIAAGTTTLVKDMFYDNLTVQNGAIVETDGFVIYAKTSVTIDVGGTIRNNGTTATGNAGGAAASSNGQLGTGTDGGAGGGAGAGVGSNNLGTFGPPGMVSNTARGGTGGTGSAGAGASGGTTTAQAETSGRMAGAWCFMSSRACEGTLTFRIGTGGGGGGGSGVAASGGGGGGGGGTVVVCSPTITNNGAIEARGGNGAAGQIGNAGGGGGGAGGMAWIVTQTYTGNAPDVSGGTGGAGSGTGTAGANGGVGITFTKLA